MRLSAHLKVFPAAEVTLPWQRPDWRPVSVGLMFTKDDEGAIWRNDWNRYVWHPALKAVGIVPGREAGFHQLRHHYASLLLADGVDIRTLAEYLGHTDLWLHSPDLLHLVPGSPDKMRQAIDRAFSESPDCPGIAREGGNGR